MDKNAMDTVTNVAIDLKNIILVEHICSVIKLVCQNSAKMYLYQLVCDTCSISNGYVIVRKEIWIASESPVYIAMFV